MTQEKIKPYEGIDIWHMICHIAKSWWKMLIAMVIFAVLLGGLSYYKNAKGLAAAAAAKEAAEEKQEETLSRILEVDEEEILAQSGLNEKAADEVLYYANKYYFNKKQYERQNNYLQESILMQMDPNNVWTATLYYDLSVPGDAGEKTAESAFAASYIAKISNETVYNEIAEELGADIDSGYFAEVITGSCLGRISEARDITVISTDSEDMKIVIRYTDREGCEKIAEIIKEKIAASSGTVTGEVGAHTITLVGEQTEQRSDGELLNEQKNQISALGALSDNVINARSNIETSEETVFNQLIEYYEARDAKKITAIKSAEAGGENVNAAQSSGNASDENASDENASDAKAAVKPRVSKKYVALGLFLGIFVIGAFEACRYFFSNALKQRKDLEEGYGLSTYDKEDRAVISMVLQNKCRKNGWKKLYAASSLGSDAVEEACSGLKPEGLQLVKSKESPLKDEDELGVLQEADGVILSEKLNVSSHKEIAKLLELCRELEKPVICALVTEK